jgi:deoxyadenosine/deoxycytidine kinase
MNKSSNKSANKSFNIVSIEGNIGSGKSTLLKHLQDYVYQHSINKVIYSQIDVLDQTSNKINSEIQTYNNCTFKLNRKIIFLKEPVAEWETIKDSKNKTMLEKFYADQKRYSFSFQMMAYISRLVYMKEAVEENPDAIIITERSLYTDKEVFAKMLFDDKKIEDVDYQIYLKWFDAFAKDYPISKIIYVKADPSICSERITTRFRKGEQGIPLEYLTRCHDYHNEMIQKYDKEYDQLILNGNIDIKNNEKQITAWLHDILLFIH